MNCSDGACSGEGNTSVDSATAALVKLTSRLTYTIAAIADLTATIYETAADTGYDMEPGADAEALDFFVRKMRRAIEEEDYEEAERAIIRAELCCVNWVTLEELGIVAMSTDTSNQPDHTDDATT